jgi:hypothetical protein
VLTLFAPYTLRYMLDPQLQRNVHRSQNRIEAYHSQLFERYQRDGNQKALDMLKKISPVGWQHIHFLWHYAFRNENPIDLAAILAALDIV